MSYQKKTIFRVKLGLCSIKWDFDITLHEIVLWAPWNTTPRDDPKSDTVEARLAAVPNQRQYLFKGVGGCSSRWSV